MRPLKDILNGASAATPGPWCLTKREYDGSVHYGIETVKAFPRQDGPGPDAVRLVAFFAGSLGEKVSHRRTEEYRDDPETKADAEFLAHARTDVPALAARITSLEERLQQDLVILEGDLDGLLANGSNVYFHQDANFLCGHVQTIRHLLGMPLRPPCSPSSRSSPGCAGGRTPLRSLTAWHCPKCGGQGAEASPRSVCAFNDCGALLPGKEDPRDARIRDLKAELATEVARTDALVASLPQCDNGAHENRPATKSEGRGGARYCDECGAPGVSANGVSRWPVRPPPDYPRAAPLRAIAEARAKGGKT